MPTEMKRTRYERLRGQLETERSSFLPHWNDLASYILPRRPRFFVSDTNRGERRSQKIIDGTATYAAQVLSSGMMSGVTNPARPWFRLTISDPDLAEAGSVKDWLHIVSQRMRDVLIRSNIYDSFPVAYGDLGVFGDAAMLVEEDFETVIHTSVFPIGSYMIATNDKGLVDVFFREFRMTVRQLLKKFAERDANGNITNWDEAFSPQIKYLYDQGNLEAWIDVCHVIQPNEDYDPERLGSKFKRYSSCYYEKGTQPGNSANYISDPAYDRYLRESGYDYFPVLVPRWDVTGEDAYATNCPGMQALGDIRALQSMHKKKAKALEKMVDPPLKGPPELRSMKVSLLPGDITWLSEREGAGKLTPIHEVNPRIQELLLDIQDHQQRINRAFYVDLILMMVSSDRREITAREVDERREEKLLALGRVLERLNKDLLDPLLDIVFAIMAKQGMIPEPPQELQGMDLKVEYISIMAQAQKLVGVAGLERFAAFTQNMLAATKDMTILDKVDVDQFLDEYGDALGLPPRVIRPDDVVAEIRAQRQQAQQAAALRDQAPGLAKAAKDLSETDVEKDSGLRRLLETAGAGA